MQIINMENCPYSDRHGSYGGQAGYKDGIIYNNEYWIVKYPKAMHEIKGSRSSISYTTSPLSEYIGSHIFQIMGYRAHDTLLCFRKSKIAVACRDFCRHRGDLMEMRTIKNAGNEILSEELQTEFASSNTGDRVNLKELLIHYERNPLLRDISGVMEHFWETAVIDILIDNGDRNNGNRGLLFDEDTKTFSIAPVYDNGNSFSNKASDRRLQEIYDNKKYFTELSVGSKTAYTLNDHNLSAKKFLQLQENGLKKALAKVVPLIKEHKQDIEAMINDIPETYHGIKVCSDIQKQFMIDGMTIRLEQLLEPALEQTQEKKKEEEPLSHEVAEKITEIENTYKSADDYAARFVKSDPFTQEAKNLVENQIRQEKRYRELLDTILQQYPEEKNMIKRELVKRIPVKLITSAEARIKNKKRREEQER